MVHEIINNIPIGYKKIIDLTKYNNNNRPNWNLENQEELFYSYFEPLFFSTDHLQMVNNEYNYNSILIDHYRN